MVSVTDEAKTILGEVLDNALKDLPSSAELPERDQYGLRLVAREGGFMFGIDAAHEGDHIIEREGNPILLIDRELDMALDGATIGTTETPEGPRLTISR